MKKIAYLAAAIGSADALDAGTSALKFGVLGQAVMNFGSVNNAIFDKAGDKVVGKADPSNSMFGFGGGGGMEIGFQYSTNSLVIDSILRISGQYSPCESKDTYKLDGDEKKDDAAAKDAAETKAVRKIKTNSICELDWLICSVGTKLSGGKIVPSIGLTFFLDFLKEAKFSLMGDAAKDKKDTEITITKKGGVNLGVGPTLGLDIKYGSNSQFYASIIASFLFGFMKNEITGDTEVTDGSGKNVKAKDAKYGDSAKTAFMTANNAKSYMLNGGFKIVIQFCLFGYLLMLGNRNKAQISADQFYGKKEPLNNISGKLINIR
jgi:hypothetical protein